MTSVFVWAKRKIWLSDIIAEFFQTHWIIHVRAQLHDGFEVWWQDCMLICKGRKSSFRFLVDGRRNLCDGGGVCMCECTYVCVCDTRS